MKHTSFPSREEHILRCDAIKRRQERILQVRLQSKEMSAAILEKVKREAQRQCEEIESQVLSEIRNYHQKELEYSRAQYEKCISDINQQHYQRQINTTANEKHLRNSSPVKSTTNSNIDRSTNKTSEDKSTSKSVENPEKRTILTRNICKKLNDKKVRVTSPQRTSQNVVIDSDNDNDIKKHTMLNFRKHSPEVKHLKSLQRNKEDENRFKCQKRSSRLNTNFHKSKLTQSKAVDEYLITDNKSDKNHIDEVYNHLVHDRIRILEQKDRILDRQTMFIPNEINLTKKTPRFSEYFARFRDSKIPSTSMVSSRHEAGTNKIISDMKRIELKKKLLKNELTQSNDEKRWKKFSSSDEKENKKKQSSPSSHEEPTTNRDSDKNSPVSNSDDSASKKISMRNKRCPSPIPKSAHSVNNSSHESDSKTTKLPSKHRQCKRKTRSNKDIQITVSNDGKSVTTKVNDTTTNFQQHGTSSSSSTSKDFQKIVTPPVKLVVNVLPSADCKIEIKNNNSDRRYVSSTAKQHAEKVKDWRTLFKNQEKLTESSYYSPPECGKVVNTAASEANYKQKVIHPSCVTTNDIGYYVRKLLLMSPQSVDNLDVSSCDTTLMDDVSRTTSIDSTVSDTSSPNFRNKPPSRQILSDRMTNVERNEVDGDENDAHDSANVKQLLLECLRLATAEPDSINLSTFKSIDSSCDNKVFDLNESSAFYTHFINTAIQRLLPLYQNSLDDNLDLTTQSAFVDVQNSTLNRTEYESDMNESRNDDRSCISSSAHLQKFVSSLSATSEKQDKNRDIIEYLKRYIELQSSVENSNKISKQQFESATNVPSKEEGYTTLPSVHELIRKGLIRESYGLNETSNEPKEYLDEEEFIKKMLQVDFNDSKESHHDKDDSGSTKFDDNDSNRVSQSDEKYATDIRKELRKLGLNWMDTTLQRTLQASIINSTSSAEDSAGALRNSIQFSSNYQQPDSSSDANASCQQPSQKFRQVLNISPITIPDLQLSVPDCFRKK